MVVNQDTGGHHEEHHDEHHEEAHEKHEEEPKEEAKEQQPEKKAEEKTEDTPEEKPKDTSDKADEKKDEKEEPKEEKKEEETSSPEKTDEVSIHPRPTLALLIPSQPTPRKEAKSQNETSGKQEGVSNTDTKHSTQIDDKEDKSKKGEGVAETAKLKGTVSSDRPQVWLCVVACFDRRWSLTDTRPRTRKSVARLSRTRSNSRLAAREAWSPPQSSPHSSHATGFHHVASCIFLEIDPYINPNPASLKRLSFDSFHHLVTWLYTVEEDS